MKIVRVSILLVILVAAITFLMNSGFKPGFLSKFNPVVGQVYPDLEYIDQNGNPLRISDFKGQVVIVELVGMPCKACHAWSGAHYKGKFHGIAPQPGLDSFKNYFTNYTRLRWGNPGITFVQILFYDLDMGHPTPEDAKNCADHFGFKAAYREYVVVPKDDLRNNRLYQQIPGFQLLDKNLILRSDATDPNGARLYSELLPSIPALLRE